MKFHFAWDSLEKENRFLKSLVYMVLLLAIFLCSVLTVVGSKDPLVIERGCYSRLAVKEINLPSDDEIKAFVEEALRARFNTGWTNSILLTSEQSVFRDKEQTELSKQKMRQTVVVNDVVLGKDSITVDADRLISVGEIRSSFKFPLKLQIKTESRSEGNPYGLVLSEIDEIHEVKK
jgi:hypothetical protein